MNRRDFLMRVGAVGAAFTVAAPGRVFASDVPAIAGFDLASGKDYYAFVFMMFSREPKAHERYCHEVTWLHPVGRVKFSFESETGLLVGEQVCYHHEVDERVEVCGWSADLLGQDGRVWLLTTRYVLRKDDSLALIPILTIERAS